MPANLANPKLWRFPLVNSWLWLAGAHSWPDWQHSQHWQPKSYLCWKCGRTVNPIQYAITPCTSSRMSTIPPSCRARYIYALSDADLRNYSHQSPITTLKHLFTSTLHTKDQLNATYRQPDARPTASLTSIPPTLHLLKTAL